MSTNWTILMTTERWAPMGTADGSEARTAGVVAGLDAAIEAAAQVICEDWSTVGHWDEASPARRGIYRRSADAILRAAYPHIRRAVLNEAADDLDRAIVRSWSAEWLRERAEEGGWRDCGTAHIGGKP